MTDPAANARTVQHIEPEETPMRIHVIDYADDPEPEYPAGWWIWAYLVALVFAALVVAVCVFVGRVM
jgi:hypothetical protein